MKSTCLAHITPALLAALVCTSHVGADFTPQPTLVYETTVTGFYLASGRQMAVDPQGNAYVAGIQTTLTGFRDAFVTKLSGQGGSILSSTFLGGDDADEGHGIALNGAGEIYIVGSTQSTDFPTVNPIQGAPMSSATRCGPSSRPPGSA